MAIAKTVTDLVDRLQKETVLVRDFWQSIEFVTCDEIDKRKGRMIVIDEVPSMKAVWLAVLEWRKARDLVVAIENELTPDERKTLDEMVRGRC